MAHNRRQKQKHNSSHNNKITRRLRLMYTDPDATDSSSDENYHFEKPKKIKRIVQELSLPNIDIHEISNGSCEDLNKGNKVEVKRRPTCKYRGVRMRKWGSWAAEIRNPMIKRGREWIGTFSTAEEASQAYEKRYLEIKEEMANAEKVKNSGNSENNVNVIMATNQEKSSNDYFVSCDSLDDSKSNTMSQTPSSLLPELNTSDCNLIDVGNVSSNEAVEANVLGVEFAKLGGEFAKVKDEFAKLDRPDSSVSNMQPLSLPILPSPSPSPSPPPPPPPAVVRAANPFQFEFACFRIDGFGDGHEYDDLGGLEDIKICGIDDKDPCGFPGFDFSVFGVDDITSRIEEPLFL